MFELQVLTWDRHKTVTKSQLSPLDNYISNINTYTCINKLENLHRFASTHNWIQCNKIHMLGTSDSFQGSILIYTYNLFYKDSNYKMLG